MSLFIANGFEMKKNLSEEIIKNLYINKLEDY